MTGDLIGEPGLLQPAHVLLARPLSAPVTHERVGIRLLEGSYQANSLGIVPRPARVLIKPPGGRQTVPEALRYRGTQSVKLRAPVGHLLAVGCDPIFPVGEHPVEAATACDLVLRCGLVEGADHVVAVPGGKLVCRAIRPVRYKVVTCVAQYVVRAFATENDVVVTTADQLLVTSRRAAFGTARDHILSLSADQAVFTGQTEDPVAVALAHKVVGSVGTLQEVATLSADFVHGQRDPASHQYGQGNGGQKQYGTSHRKTRLP